MKHENAESREYLMDSMMLYNIFVYCQGIDHQIHHDRCFLPYNYLFISILYNRMTLIIKYQENINEHNGQKLTFYINADSHINNLLPRYRVSLLK